MEILFSNEFRKNYVFLRIYLLNYTTKIFNISLVVVFHQTSSVSMLYLLYQHVKELRFEIRFNFKYYINNIVLYKIISNF